jgi:N-methylhydantoinase B/oxoprolinase/acetone carboxylase alpha subunit
MYDPIELEIFKSIFISICQEMGVTLQRTSFSPNIKERRDYSCALFDPQGEAVALGDHMPVHLGSMPSSVQSAIEHVELFPNDCIILNDPFHGGTHLPDITIISPIFLAREDKPTYIVANRAHHADVGGISPGSMPISTEIFQEGIIIPPAKLINRGTLNKDLMNFILSNVRTPQEREGDIWAQIAANKIGERRLLEITKKYGRQKVLLYMSELQDYTERIARKTIKEIPDGEYQFTDFMDDDGIDSEPVKVAVQIKIKDDSAEIDFSASSSQVRGCINAVDAITLSAVAYVFRCIIPLDIPFNSGIFRPLKLITPKNSIVNASFPSAVAGGNVETSQRIVDVLLGALAQALPDIIPAASSGTMNNVTIGGINPRTDKPFAYYETISGGMGARPGLDGLCGVHTHMTNSLNTPIEAIEHCAPLRINQYALRKDSGGAGKYRGGEGVIREYELLTNCEFTIISDRRKFSPYGLAGGLSGKPGKNTVITPEGEKILGSKATITAKKGWKILIQTPGGGGLGFPQKKDIIENKKNK